MKSMAFVRWPLMLAICTAAISERHLHNIFQPRIIGGFDAPQGRYPYMVELVNRDGSQRCGGVLVATDVVLTAAHCSGGLGRAYIGRWNRKNANEIYDNLALSAKEYIHPSFVENGITSYDFMLLKLTQQSSRPYIKLNENPDIPSGRRTNEVTALGFGTVSANVDEYPTILQRVKLTYIPNNVCKNSKDPLYAENYRGLILDVMLCAGDYGQDTCSGDSGGPLIIDGGSADKDILVGIVSWGFGCAIPAFPGVYSRVSHEVEWIRQTICFISEDPPIEYDCSLYSPPPTKNSVPVTIRLELDDFPEETGWTVRNKADGTVLGQAVPGDYKEKRATVIETVFLPSGSTCIFEITDAYGDGLCCSQPGTYLVILGRVETGTVLASGGDKFGGSQQHELEIPESYDDPATNGPIVGEGQIALTVVLQLDNNPLDNGWRIDQVGGLEAKEVIRVPPGVYRTPLAKIVRTIALDEDELYSFSVTDLGNNGFDDGYVQLFLGTTDVEDSSRMIFENKGNFEGSMEFSFISSFDDDYTSPPKLNGELFLTLVLQLDLYPEEIGFQLRAKRTDTAIARQNTDDVVIFFRPPRYYAGMSRQTVTEIIPLPSIRPGAIREFTFIITDSHGDGLCCSWSGDNGILPGYTMYQRGPGLGNVLFNSNMQDTNREVHEFTIDGPPADFGQTLRPTQPIPTVNIKVTITLDGYPTETGFYIKDAIGSTVVDRPPGTFSTPNEVMEEFITLEIGVYEFSIVDSFENGLERRDSYYRLDIADDEGRPALLAGSGRFNTQESKVFVLEGDTANFPLEIEFSTDSKPTEFGFFVKRQDLQAPEAFVADVPKGSFLVRNEKTTKSVMIRKGGLYRIVFIDSGRDGIGGNILVKVGAKLDSKTYSVDFTDRSSWQLQFLAGDLPATHDKAKKLDLRVKFDQFPQEFNWIVVADAEYDLEDLGRSLQEQEVVAFSNTLYSQDLENQEIREEIALPDHIGERKFMMILTDSEGDGVCCDFDFGGPVELFDGERLLFSDPFQREDRAYHFFTITGNGITSASASIGTAYSSLIFAAFVVFAMK
eukprot:scaffold26676_cov137-Cylindrotheca_fusiformis.AAC.5